MTLPIGTTIRIIRETSGFRESAMYSAIPVKANSYAEVINTPGTWTSAQKAAVLKYVKRGKTWKKTKVIITLQMSWFPGFGEGHHWERTDPLDELALIDG